MTVTRIYSPTRTVGNASTTEFTANWQVPDESDVDVYLIDTTATTNKVLQTITTHYTVTINEATENATITFVTAPPATKDVILERSIANTQVEDIPDVATIRENQLEDPLDRNTMLIQQVEEKLNRKYGSSVADDTNLTITYDLPTPVDNRALFWSLSGSVASIVNSSTDLSDIDASVLATAADAVSTAADVVTTNADAVSTAADAVSTAADAASAAASAASVSSIAVANNVSWSCTHVSQVVIAAGASFEGVSSGDKFSFASGVTMDIAGTGGVALGLDTGAEAANKWYYIIALGNSAAPTVSSAWFVEASTYAAFVVGDVPAGYTDYKYLGAVYNNGTDFRFSTFHHGEVSIEEATGSSTGSTSYTNIDLSGRVPPLCRFAKVIFYNTTANSSYWQHDGVTGNGHEIMTSAGANTTEVFLTTAQIFEVKTSAGTLAWEVSSYKDTLQNEGQ